MRKTQISELRVPGDDLCGCSRHSGLDIPKHKRRRRHLGYARTMIGRSAGVMTTTARLPTVDLDVSDDPADGAEDFSDDNGESPEITVAEPTMEDDALCGCDQLIKWKNGARPCQRSAYLGSSKRTQFRKQSEKKRRIESVRDCKTIDSYFHPLKNHGTSPSATNAHGIVEPALCLPSLHDQITHALRQICALTDISANQFHEKQFKT